MSSSVIMTLIKTSHSFFDRSFVLSFLFLSSSLSLSLLFILSSFNYFLRFHD